MTESNTLVPPSSSIGHVSIKPPPFYVSNPQTWFLQLESQFALAGITSSATKFHHVLAALPEDVAVNIASTSNDYESLKKEILNNLKANKHVLIQQALNTVEMGNKRPAQFVSEIKRRFTDVGLTPDDDVIKARLSAALSPQIRTALVGHDDATLDNYVKIADSMLAVAQPNNNPFHMGEIRSALPHSENQHPHSYSSHQFRQSNAPPPPRTSQTDVRPFYSGQRPRICNAHIFYAERARTCRRWCRWPQKPRHILKDSDKTPRQSRPSSPLNS